MNNLSADRIVAIQKSLRAFVSGIIGFLPIIGVVPAIYALVCCFQVRSRYRDWNPASPYLTVGATLASLGLAGSLLIIATVLLVYCDQIF